MLFEGLEPEVYPRLSIHTQQRETAGGIRSNEFQHMWRNNQFKLKFQMHADLLRPWSCLPSVLLILQFVSFQTHPSQTASHEQGGYKQHVFQPQCFTNLSK